MRVLLRASWRLATLILLPLSSQAAVHQVGPGREFTHLQALLDVTDFAPGDVVEVDGGVEYPGNVILRPQHGGAAGSPVVLRGLRVNGARPILRGGTSTIEFRLANHVVFESFEVVGSVDDGTTRCVFHHSNDLLIRDVLVRDCPMHGILGADNDSGSLTIEYSEIRNAGSDTYHHAIYMATDQRAFPGSVFRLRHSVVRDSRYGDSGEGGNLIKSRAERNEIHYNWLQGAYYHSLELIGPDPSGGATQSGAREDSDVVGNVIVHDGEFGSVFRLGGDGTGQSQGRYRFVNNTVVRPGQGGVSTVFRLFDGIEALEAHNNVLVNTDGVFRVYSDGDAQWVGGAPRLHGSHNWISEGAGYIPDGWTDTTEGDEPGFVNVAASDFRPGADSELRDAGGDAVSAPGFEISATLFPPTRQPPRGVVEAAGSASVRAVDARIDIGAFESTGSE
ncbi:hypothetical protein [Aquimonas sp.]|jgi:hypothetical protein|uniref:hypothetical protein n=1 Tax=Aquimonas sp. TaxID=1872588 RepID=UPI0037BF7048